MVDEVKPLRLILALAFATAALPVCGQATLVLDYPCQDDAATSTIDDVSTNDADGFLAGVSVNTEDYSVAGPGEDYPKALDCVSAGPVYPYVGLAPTINWGSTGGALTFNVKRDNAGNTDQISGDFSTGTKIWFTNDGKIKLTDTDPATYEADLTGIDTTEWHAYAIFDIGSELWLYVDGRPQDEFDGMPAGDSVFSAFGHDDGGLYSDMPICGIRVRNGGEVDVADIEADAEDAGLLAADITSDLAAHYTFDTDGSDSSGNGRNLTMTGTVTHGAGKKGNAALGINATNFYGYPTPTFWDALANGTVAMWVQDSAYASGGAAISYGTANASFVIVTYPFDTSGGNGLRQFANAVTSADLNNSKPATGSWQFVCYTWAGGTGQLYINGDAPVAIASSIATPASQTHLRFGMYHNGGQAYDGDIDEVHLYTRELSAGDVAALYADGSVTPPSGSAASIFGSSKIFGGIVR